MYNYPCDSKYLSAWTVTKRNGKIYKINIKQIRYRKNDKYKSQCSRERKNLCISTITYIKKQVYNLNILIHGLETSLSARHIFT